MRIYTKARSIFAHRMIIMATLVLLVATNVPTEGTVNTAYGTQNPQGLPVQSDLGALATRERLIIGEDTSFEVRFEIHVEFGFVEDSDGSISVGARIGNLVVVNNESILPLSKIDCTLKSYPFLYLNNTVEFDYWTDGTPADVSSGIASELSPGNSQSWGEGLIASEDVEDITNAGFVFEFENLTASFGEYQDTELIRCGPESIILGVNFTLSDGVVTLEENIDGSTGTETISYDEDNVLIDFSQVLPTQSTPDTPFDAVTVMLIVGVTTGIVVAIFFLIKRQ